MRRTPGPVLLMLFILLPAQGQVVIPTPLVMKPLQGECRISKENITLYSCDRDGVWIELLKETLLPCFQGNLAGRSSGASLRFIRDKRCKKDAYKLKITPRHIEIRASDKGGFVYALQTLRQLESTGGGKDYLLFPCLYIADRPRTPWRGFMLDSGRQYQSVATLKRCIDYLSLLKMNIFHWHLTEGLGWRMEIKRYPRLTSVGAYVAHGEEQQGYYTQEEIAEIVRYAAVRNVTVVPEIDMPGHVEAALCAYPELGCRGTVPQVPQTGFTDNILCAGNDSTIAFVKNILDEVCALFPSPYIHLGGDEAPKGAWEECDKCQKRIRDEHLEGSHDLQLWLSAQWARYLETKGRKAIFCGDVVYRKGYPLPHNAIIQWWNWRGHQDLALRNALSQGLPVICSTNYYNYLNFPLTPWKGYGKDRTFSLEEVYNSNPSYRATLEGNPLVLGMECALWCDYGLTQGMIEGRLFPRIMAIAQQMWHTGKACDDATFKRQVRHKMDWMLRQGAHQQ